jgi:hypothetical protein
MRRLWARIRPEAPMNVGKTLFAQVMDFLPWKNFHRIVTRYGICATDVSRKPARH